MILKNYNQTTTKTEIYLKINDKFLISLDEFDYYELKNHSDFKDIKEYQKYLFNLNTTDNLDFAHIFYENYPRLPKYTPTNQKFWGDSNYKEPESFKDLLDFYKELFSEYSVSFIKVEIITNITKELSLFEIK